MKKILALFLGFAAVAAAQITPIANLVVENSVGVGLTGVLLGNGSSPTTATALSGASPELIYWTGSGYAPILISTGLTVNAGSPATLTASGGGSGSPGGSSGQVQWNNAGNFGGFTLGGDATLVASTGILTLATVNSNVGTFAGITVNAKGLVTGATALTTLAGYGITNAVTNTRNVNTSSPLAGGGALSSDLTLSIPAATSSQNGYLASGDWSTFNGKQAAGNYITALTGDATASGPGSVALTLATVNSNTGTFGSSTTYPQFTVNGKGLITAASSNTPSVSIAGNSINPFGGSVSLDSILNSPGSVAQGDILWYNGTHWVYLTPGTNGQFLQTLGASANIQWATGGGAVSSVSGTTNQVTVSPTTGAVVVSLPTTVIGVNVLTAAASTALTLESGGAAPGIVISTGNNVLVGTSTDNSNGILQINSSSSSTAGLAFGNDSPQASIYRSAASSLTSPASWTVDGTFTLTPAARSSGTNAYLTVNIPADTGITAATEAIGVNHATATRTWATTGTVALQAENMWSGPTYASANASQTFTDVMTAEFTPPIVGSNAIFTRRHTLGILDSTASSSSITGGFIVATTFGTGSTSVGIGGGVIWAGTGINSPSFTDTTSSNSNVIPLLFANTSNSSAAFVGMELSNGTRHLTLTYTGTGNTTATVTNGATTEAGTLWTNGAFPLQFGTNSTLALSLASGGAATFASSITESSATMIATNTTFTNNAASSAGTLTNAPAVGNPTKWIPINDNGTTRNIPAW